MFTRATLRPFTVRSTWRPLAACVAGGALATSLLASSAQGVPAGDRRDADTPGNASLVTLIEPAEIVELPGPELRHLLRDAPTPAAELVTIEKWIASTRVAGGDDTDAGPGVDGMTRAQLEDWAQVARQTGQSVTEVVATYGHQETYRELSAWLESTYPDRFGGMSLDDDEAVPTLRFVGPIPADVRAAIMASPRGAWVRSSGASDADVESFLLDAHTILDDVIVPLNVTWDRDDEVVLVRVGDQRIVAQLQQRLDDSARAPAHVEFSPALAEPGAGALDDTTARGGAGLDSGFCTAGFILRRESDGLKRNSTAGHCYDAGASVGYQNQPVDGGSTTVGVTWSRNTSADGDVALLSTGAFSPYPSFYYSFTAKRVASAQATSRPNVGDWLCHFGMTTGNSCGQVSDTLACFNICGLVGLDPATRDHGDSGGPWFAGSIAFGIHHAKLDDETSATFTPIWRFNDVGYEVWTN